MADNIVLSPADLVKVSSDILLEMESKVGETIGLGMFDPETLTGVVIARARGTSGFAFHLDIDYHFPLHTSAPGKVFLAYMQEPQKTNVLAQLELLKHTPSTITDPAEFKAEVNNVLAKGYSHDVGEQIAGCHCVGVPIFDSDQHQVIAALWATGPSTFLPVRSFDQIADILRDGAAKINKRLLNSSRSVDRKYINQVVVNAQQILIKNVSVTVDVSALAQQLNVGYSWFRKVFKEQVGIPPAEFHKQKRMEKAKALLIETHLSINEISKLLGFKNQNHFSAAFKRFYQVPPKALREDTEFNI